MDRKNDSQGLKNSHMSILKCHLISCRPDALKMAQRAVKKKEPKFKKHVEENANKKEAEIKN